ncbi:MAG TPA: DNA-3-methyladenine glycosylase [Pirellulaceae bacterium]
MPALTRDFYLRDPAVVARDLVGKNLWRQTSAGLCGGRIVEVEAYLSTRDSACHASRGQTNRNKSMFGPPGHAYVYMIHSRWCLNAVTEPAGTPSAVLIRALEPLVGLEWMHERRRTDIVRDLTRGPARLCEALAIDRTYDGWDLTAGRELWIAADDEPAHRKLRLGRSGRIGLSSAQRRLLRFFEIGNRFVSGRTAAHKNKA